MLRRSVATLLAGVLLVVSASAAGAQARPSPLPRDQRFVFEDHRIAVTIPAGWRVAHASQGLPIFERVLVAREAGGAGRCILETFRFEGGRLDEIASTLSSIQGYRKAQVAPAITLPAGDAVRLHAPALPKRGQDVSDTYIFEADDGYAWLKCITSDAYAGRVWYRIAASLELLASGTPSAEDAPLETTGLPACAELEAAFRSDRTTGSVLEDAVYLTRCASCEELRTLVAFLLPADMELALAILRERCSPGSIAPPGSGS